MPEESRIPSLDMKCDELTSAFARLRSSLAMRSAAIATALDSQRADSMRNQNIIIATVLGVGVAIVVILLAGMTYAAR